eukprot:GFUD01043248.1.p1 GENE.GFUD01043248.1~~GFUD01043248.1.p1  ORF type:complete len:299 (+),score=37.85 GFUD01043248.1:132-1028(+)
MTGLVGRSIDRIIWGLTIFGLVNPLPSNVVPGLSSLPSLLGVPGVPVVPGVPATSAAGFLSQYGINTVTIPDDLLEELGAKVAQCATILDPCYPILDSDSPSAVVAFTSCLNEKQKEADNCIRVANVVAQFKAMKREGVELLDLFACVDPISGTVCISIVTGVIITALVIVGVTAVAQRNAGIRGGGGSLSQSIKNLQYYGEELIRNGVENIDDLIRETSDIVRVKDPEVLTFTDTDTVIDDEPDDSSKKCGEKYPFFSGGHCRRNCFPHEKVHPDHWTDDLCFDPSEYCCIPLFISI